MDLCRIVKGGSIDTGGVLSSFKLDPGVCVGGGGGGGGERSCWH